MPGAAAVLRSRLGKKFTVTHETFSNPQKISLFLIRTLKVHFSPFFTLDENGGWSQEAPGEGPNRTRP